MLRKSQRLFIPVILSLAVSVLGARTACKWLRRLAVQVLCFGWFASSHAAQLGLAENIAQPVSRTDFENRIWLLDLRAKADSGSRPQLGSTKVIAGNSAHDLDGNIDVCDFSKPCRQNVFVAGTGYLKDYSGEKNTVLVSTPDQPARNIALLSAFVNAEGLTDAFLAIFEPNKDMPQCSVPIKVLGDKFMYGSWRIKAVYRTPKGEYLTWLQAGGGDGGWSWGLQTFVTLTPDCKLSDHKSYLVSEAPVEECKLRAPKLDIWFSVSRMGTVALQRIKKSCLDLSIKSTQDIRVDR